MRPNIVINDRGFDAGDLGTPEREYSAGADRRLTRFSRPKEANDSTGTQSWGFRMSEDYYSVPFLINSINGYMAKGAHYLLNIGPDEIGRLPEKSLQILSAVGNWYLAVREALEHSEPASELTTNASVLLTRRGCNLYVHIPSTARAEAVVLLNDRRSLSTSTELLPVYWASGERYLVVRDIPASELTDRTLVIKLEFAGPWAAALSAGAAEEVAGYVFRALRQLGSVSGEICGVSCHTPPGLKMPSGSHIAFWRGCGP